MKMTDNNAKFFPLPLRPFARDQSNTLAKRH
jgi:hypothetical protein